MPLKLAFSCFIPKLSTGAITCATPIVIGHCIFGHRGNWDEIAQTIAEKYQRKVFTVDARNHGESPKVETGTLSDMANDLTHFLQLNDIKSCNLIGHSLGGLSGMIVALTKPSIFKTLTVVDVSPIRGPTSMIPHVMAMAKGLRDSLKIINQNMSLTEAKSKCEEFLLTKEIVDKTMAKVLSSNLVKRPDGNFDCLVNYDYVEKRFESDLFNFPKMNTIYEKPTQFICAEKPHFVKPEDHKSLKEVFPKAEITCLKGASHQVHLDVPEKFLQTFMEFLERNT